MALTRRTLMETVLASALLPVCGKGEARVDAREELVSRLDKALTSAARYLIKKQSPDGAWLSETYGAFKDGPSLTPLVLNALVFLPQGGEPGKESLRKGVSYLVGMVGADGKIQAGERGLSFPVLTSASAVRLLALAEKTEENKRAQAGWMAFLRQYHLDEKLGWKRADPEFGGWGFSLQIPRKSPPGSPKDLSASSNMVASVFALAALMSVAKPADDSTFGELLTFVQRCQNFADDPTKADPRYDDGGFVFTPNNGLLNRGGVAGKDKFGKERYGSYGSMTADGLRALLRCGLPGDHPRVLAARRWLERNFSPKTHPGKFARDREVLRDAVYFYYAWAVAHAFLALGVLDIETRTGKVNWAVALSEELLRRQRPDGSWKNRFTDAKEDDPLIATSWAASALAICHQMLRPQD
jgi:hypothetical protein